MKKYLSMLLIVAILVSSSAVITQAVVSPDYAYGEVDENEGIGITDATLIQRFLAGSAELRKLRFELADFDGDGSINIFDATKIQMYVAGILKCIPRSPQAIYTSVEIENVSADFESGKAIAGVPVNFSAKAYVPYGEREAYPITYEYYITLDEMPVEGGFYRDKNSNFEFTFNEGGKYTIELRVYNSYGEYSSYEFEYDVLRESSDELIVSALYPSKFDFDEDENISVVAHAYGGEGPYEYCFKLENEVVQDFSESNSVKLDAFSGMTRHVLCTVSVIVRDKKGNIANDSCSFWVYENLPK